MSLDGVRELLVARRGCTDSRQCSLGSILFNFELKFIINSKSSRKFDARLEAWSEDTDKAKCDKNMEVRQTLLFLVPFLLLWKLCTCTRASLNCSSTNRVVTGSQDVRMEELLTFMLDSKLHIDKKKTVIGLCAGLSPGLSVWHLHVLHFGVCALMITLPLITYLSTTSHFFLSLYKWMQSKHLSQPTRDFNKEFDCYCRRWKCHQMQGQTC